MKSAIAAAALALAVVAAPAQALVHTFEATLSGANEVSPTGEPGAGDPDGTGFATIRLDDAANLLDWEITVANIELPVTLAHIHRGPAGQNGPVVVDFNAMLAGADLPIGAALAAEILGDPGGFYVNIHNAPFPGGAVRGQLAEVAEPATLALLLAGLLAAGALRRLRP
jgi:ABC-type amino acid transport substrate-binding protein